MKHTWRLQLVFVATMAAAAVGARTEFDICLEVINSSGSIIPRFEVAVFTHEIGLFPWKEGKDGQISLRSQDPDCFIAGISNNYHIIVRAKDYAPYILKLNRPEGNIERTVTLDKGLRVKLMLTAADERLVPESLVPTVVFPEYRKELRSSFQTHNGEYRHRRNLNMTSLVKLKRGQYVFNAPEDSPEIYVFIDHPGFMRAFQAGPFGRKDLADGRLKVELPKPTRLQVVFEPPKDWVGDLPYAKCSVTVCQENPENEESGFPVAFIRSDTPRLHMDQEFFAPGNYWVMLNTGPADNSAPFEWGRVNPAYFRDMKKYSLSGEQMETVIFQYTPYDENAYKGDYSAVVNVCWHNGKPAAGAAYVVYYQDKHFGPINIKEGTITDDGQVELTGLGGGDDAPHFALEIDKGKRGRYFIQLDGEQKHRLLKYKIAPLEGDVAPNIALRDVFSGEKVKMANYKGKIILLEFWHTGCGPCQSPLAKLCEVVSRRKKDWKDKVEVLAISIDTKKENVVEHVRGRGWLALRHLWCDEGEHGWKSDGAQAYGITGVPTALLIDQSGQIVWRGHPASFDIEANIDKLLRNR